MRRVSGTRIVVHRIRPDLAQVGVELDQAGVADRGGTVWTSPPAVEFPPPQGVVKEQLLDALRSEGIDTAARGAGRQGGNRGLIL